MIKIDRKDQDVQTELEKITKQRIAIHMIKIDRKGQDVHMEQDETKRQEIV